MRVRPVNICLIIVFILVLAVFCAGCSSSPDTTSRNRTGSDGHVGENRTLPSPGTPVSAARTLPSLTVARPDGTFIAPEVSLTVNTESELYQNLTALSEILKVVSAEWDPTTYSCSGRSCDAGFVDTSGNTMTVKVTLYDTTDPAKAAFEAAKQQASSYRMTAFDTGDEGYVWQHLKFAGAGVLEKNVVLLIDYTAHSGMAGTEDVKEVASALSENLSKNS